MAKISFAMLEDTAFEQPYKTLPAHQQEGLNEGEMSTEVRRMFPRDGEPLQVFEVKMDPDVAVRQHVHTTDEIIIVTEGQLHFGARVCGPGSAVFVPGNTLYAFKTGPQGVRFYNFRGATDSVMMFRDEFMARRADRKEQSVGSA